jgi:endo-1,4-beta-D-glucanase Y
MTAPRIAFMGAGAIGSYLGAFMTQAGYEADARALLQAIKGSAIDTSCGRTVLKPGDTFGGCSETNPSYVAPAYYEEFQKLDGDAVWTALRDDGYTLLAGNQQRKGGIFSDWSNQDGGTSTGSHSDDFGPDASRVPWRVATDYVWNGEARAVAILDTFRSYVDAQGGPARSFTPNSNFRGGSAFSAIAGDASTAQEYAEAWLLSSVDDNTYFPGTLRPLYMLLAANVFAKGCD